MGESQRTNGQLMHFVVVASSKFVAGARDKSNLDVQKIGNKTDL